MVVTTPTSGFPAGVLTFLLARVDDAGRASAAPSDGMDRPARSLEEQIAAGGGALLPDPAGAGTTIAVFASAVRALEVAAAVSGSLAAGAPDRAGPVRMGVHTGEADLADGGYEGPTFARCAQLLDLAGRGQILVSEVTAAIAGGLLGGLVLREVPAARAGGVDGSPGVFRLEHSGSPTSPEVGAVDDALPEFATSFVGREAEIDEVGELVRSAPLVTVTGTGGAGKTRLVREVVRRVGASFVDGVVWVDLGRVTDRGGVASEVAASCGLAESPGGLDAARMVEQHLRTNQRLVVLDNCEHVLEGAIEVAELVAGRAGRSVFLATSREPLGVAGEVVWRIPSLALPDAPGDDEARRASAVRLFLDRAAAADPSFAPAANELTRVVAIVRRLDGIPLAIELAAARLRALSLSDLAAGLDDRFRVLTAGPGPLERHRTLRASVDWSHDLLDEPSRIAFRRLSVFVGTFTLSDAEAVIAGDPLRSVEVFALVASLVDKSLVQRVAGGYAMLESIRSYALERRAEAGELDAIRERHFRHLCDLARGWALDTTLPSSATLAAAGAHIADLRAAYAWGASVDADEAAVLVVALANTLAASDRYDESNELVHRALQGIPEGSTRWCELVASTMASLSMGAMWWQEGASLALADPGRLDDRVRRRLHAGLAMPELMGGTVGVADELAGLVDRAQAEGDRAFALTTGIDIAYYAAHNGDLTRTTSYLDWAERHLSDSPRTAAAARGTHIMVAAYRAETATVVGHISAALRSSTIDPREMMAAIVGAQFIGSIPLMRQLRERIRRVELSGTVEFVPAWVELNLAVLEGDNGAARRWIETILDLSFVGSVQAMRMIAADIALADGDPVAARAFSNQALELLDGVDCPYVLAMATETAAQLDRLDGEIRRALERAHAALELSCAHGLVSGQLNVLENLAVIMGHAGQRTDAARLLGACDAFRNRSGFALRVPYLIPMIAELDQSLDVAHRAEGAALGLDDAVALARRRRGKRGRPPAGWDSLTPSEERVVALVAEGSTNQQVADALVVSLATVKTHLSHVYVKLGITSRTQLVNAYRTRDDAT